MSGCLRNNPTLRRRVNAALTSSLSPGPVPGFLRLVPKLCVGTDTRKRCFLKTGLALSIDALPPLSAC